MADGMPRLTSAFGNEEVLLPSLDTGGVVRRSDNNVLALDSDTNIGLAKTGSDVLLLGLIDWDCPIAEDGAVVAHSMLPAVLIAPKTDDRGLATPGKLPPVTPSNESLDLARASRLRIVVCSSSAVDRGPGSGAIALAFHNASRPNMVSGLARRRSRSWPMLKLRIALASSFRL